jgi:hypothetical protein
MPARTLATAVILWSATLLSGREAVSAAAPCAHDEICSLKNPEDMIRQGGSHWALVSRLGRDPEAPGGFSLVDLEARTSQVLTPDVSKPAVAMYAACPRPPVASDLITHGLDVRRGARGCTAPPAPPLRTDTDRRNSQ